MAEQGKPRRLAAIFAADIIGHARLMETDKMRTVACHVSYRAEMTDKDYAA